MLNRILKISVAGTTLLSVILGTAHGESEKIEASFFNQESVYIASDPSNVWNTIKQRYTQASHYAEQGYVITKIEHDPAAFRGGYEALLLGDQPEKLDHRRVYVTYVDDEERIISLLADYLTPNFDGLRVNAMYTVKKENSGSRLEITSMAQKNFTLDAEQQQSPTLAQQIIAIEEGASASLISAMNELKVELETTHPAKTNEQ